MRADEGMDREERERFLNEGILPAQITKGFINVLTADERRSVVYALTEELETATEDRHARTIALRVARVNRARKAKGELRKAGKGEMKR